MKPIQKILSFKFSLFNLKFKIKNLKFALILTPFYLLTLLPSSSILAEVRSATDNPQSAIRNPKSEIDTLALVNGQPITNEDFLNRFEMSVYPGKDDPTMFEKHKREFLYSMIAEKLLAQAALQSNLPYTPSEEALRKVMEEMFMRDALFRQEVLPRAQVSNDELLHGFDISVYKYIVDAFYFDDSASASGFYRLLYRMPKPDIYKLADSLRVSHDTLEIPYGESTAEIENAFFGHRKGFISKPAITVDGWVIFKVLTCELNERFMSGSTPDRLNRIHEILVSREEEKLGNQYVESVMKNVEVNVNYDIFRPLVYAIQKIFGKQDLLSYDSYYQLTSADLLDLRQKFASDLDKPLLSFKGGFISLDKVFQELPTALFASQDTSLPEITFALHGSLRFISQNYFLVKRAEELGLRNSPEVKYNVQMFLDSFRSYRMANEITDTVKVTQAEVDKFFAEHHDEVLNAVKLKLKMYETDNINEAIDIFAKLNKEKNERIDSTDARWVGAFNLGEIGALLSELKAGDVYGPVEADSGKFYIYQLLDKKSSVNDSAIENSIEVAKEILTAREKREALDKYIAKLAEDDDMKIFRENVAEVKVTHFQMLTFRYIGFGGRIIAVPQLYPREDWIKYFQQKKPPQP